MQIVCDIYLHRLERMTALVDVPAHTRQLPGRLTPLVIVKCNPTGNPCGWDAAIRCAAQELESARRKLLFRRFSSIVPHKYPPSGQWT